MSDVIRFSDVSDANPFPGVVSKAVLNREKGSAAITVGELRIEPGHRLPLHIHQVEEALVFISGEAEVEMDGEKTSVTARSVMRVPAGARHTILNSGSTELNIIFMFPAVEVQRILI